MSRRILWFGLAASAALHAWLIWPRPRPAAPAEVQSPPMPKAIVAVRALPPEEQPTPQPESPATPAPAPGPDAAPASPPPALAQAPIDPPPTPPQSQEPPPASAAAALESVPDSGPVPLHAAEPLQEAVIEGGVSDSPQAEPASEAMADRIDEFEESLRQLREQAPRPVEVAEPAPPSVRADPAPAPTPVAPPRTPAPPVQTASVPAPLPPRAPRPLALPWLTRTASSDAAPVAARMPSSERPSVQPLAARAPSPSVEPRSRVGAPATAVLRTPQPYRPISTSGRPARARVDATVAAPPPVPITSAIAGRPADRGVRTDAAPQRPSEPVARIAWGDPAEAMRAIDQGRMLLVRVNDALEIVGGLERSDGAWRRAAAVPSLGAYSNRVRVVDHVGAFAEPAQLCGRGEHLAVVVPIGLERRFERAMRDAATRAGMLWSGVAACYGRLVPTSTGIEFAIDRVEPRAAP